MHGIYLHLAGVYPGDGFKDFLFSSPLGEMIQFDYSHIFSDGLFNHQLEDWDEIL